jgi:hypothetical protein
VEKILGVFVLVAAQERRHLQIHLITASTIQILQI